MDNVSIILTTIPLHFFFVISKFVLLQRRGEEKADKIEVHGSSSVVSRKIAIPINRSNAYTIQNLITLLHAGGQIKIPVIQH